MLTEENADFINGAITFLRYAFYYWLGFWALYFVFKYVLAPLGRKLQWLWNWSDRATAERVKKRMRDLGY